MALAEESAAAQTADVVDGGDLVELCCIQSPVIPTTLEEGDLVIQHFNGFQRVKGQNFDVAGAVAAAAAADGAAVAATSFRSPCRQPFFDPTIRRRRRRV